MNKLTRVGSGVLSTLFTLCLIVADAGVTSEPQSKLEVLEGLYAEAHQAFQEGKWDLAQLKLDLLLQLQADIPEALNLLGAVCDKAKRPRDAERHFRKAVELKPDYIEARKNLGLHLAKQGEIEGAVVELTAASKLQPNDLEIHYLLGRVLFKNNDLSKAVIHLSESAKDSRFQTAEAFSMLGMAKLRSGALSDAQHYLEEAVRRGAADAQVQIDLGEAYEKQGEIQKATSSYLIATKMKPEMDLGHALLARCYQRQGQLQPAIEHYKEALKLKPKSQEYMLALASSYFEAQKYEDTVRVLNQWPDSEKGSACLNLRGSSYAKLGKTAEAGTDFEQAITLNPKDIEAYYNLGLLLLQARSHEQAVRAFEQALDLFPQSEKLLTALGFSYQLKGDLNAARSVFSRMAKLFPEKSDPHFYLGSSFLEAGQQNEALSALDTGQGKRPEGPSHLLLNGADSLQSRPVF